MTIDYRIMNKLELNYKVLLEFFFGFSLIILSSLLALYFVKYQFGGYDLSPIIDLSWRLKNGEIPGQDFINTMPLIIILLLKLNIFEHLSWFDLTFLNIIAVIVTYFSLGIFDDIFDYSVLYSFFVPLVLCIPLVFTNHIWHSSISQYIAIIFVFTIYISLQKKNKIGFIHFTLIFIFSALMVTAKQNVSAPFIFATIIYTALIKNSNKFSLLSGIIFGAISGILFVKYIFNMSFYALFYSYYAVVSRGKPTKEMLEIVFSGTTNQFLVIIILLLCGVLSMTIKKSIFNKSYSYLVLCSFISFVPFITDWDSKFNNISLILFIACLFLCHPEVGIFNKNNNKYPEFIVVLKAFIISLFVFIYSAAIYGGYSRERMKAVGPFYQIPANLEIKDGYFNGLVTGQDLFIILKEIKIIKSQFPKEKIFFGPRIEFGYLLTKSKSPERMPLWWHPGTSYLIEDQNKIVDDFVKNNFDVLVFFRSDRTRMPYEILNFIESKYIQLEGTNYTDVYLREDYLK